MKHRIAEREIFVGYDCDLLTLIEKRTGGVAGATAGTLAELRRMSSLAPTTFAQALNTLRDAQVIEISRDGMVRLRARGLEG